MAKLVVIFALQVSALLAQAAVSLSVTGAVKHPLRLSAEDLSKMPRASIINKEEGRDVKYEGVPLYDILLKAGAPLGKELNGKNMAFCVLASARDGYSVAYALAEFDPGFTDSQTIVADTIDGKPLFGYQGPFRIVMPNQKKAARSVRMLEKIEVISLKPEPK